MAGGNPCDWDNLNSSQQSMLNESNWGDYSAAQQQEFMDVSLDAAAIGVDLSGFKVESITIAGENRATQTAVNLQGNTEPLRGWLDDSEVFTSRADDPLVRAPAPWLHRQLPPKRALVFDADQHQHKRRANRY